MKKALSLLIVAVLLLSLVGCSSSSSITSSAVTSTSNSTEEKVDITFLVTKPEIVTQFEEVFSRFTQEYPHINISVIPLSGQTIYEKLTSLYASGNAPTITMVGGPEFTAFKDNFLDVSETDFASKVYDWALEKTTVDGKVLAIPTTAEGIGIMYNKTVIEAATGKEFDPSSIKSRQDFAAILEEISQSDYAPVQITNKDWLLGSHLTSVLYGASSSNYEERQKVLAQSATGEYDLTTSDAFNGWMDTFDLLMKYNMNSSSPLANVYEDDQLLMGSDEVAFWPIGNYVYPNIAEVNPNVDVGLMPYPMTDTSGDFGNEEIVLTYSMFAIDAKQSTEAQQQAAIDFFNWLITSENGQDAYINTLVFIPVFEGFNVQPSNPVAQQIVGYMSQGKTIERMSDYFPAGITTEFGATMQQYLAGKLTRDEVAKQFSDAWVSFSNK